MLRLRELRASSRSPVVNATAISAGAVATIALGMLALALSGTELRDKHAPDVRPYCAKDTAACFATCERAGLALYEAQSAVGLYSCPRGEPLACLCIERPTTNERSEEP